MMSATSLFAVIAPLGGRLDDATAGILAYSVRLARLLGIKWRAVSLSALDEHGLEGAGRYGTPEITVAASVADYADRPEVMGKIISQYLRQREFPIIVLPHNDLGTTLAPIIAAGLDAALVSEAGEVLPEEGGLSIYRNVLGCRMSERRLLSAGRPLVLTVPVDTLSSVEVAPAEQCTTSLVLWEQELETLPPSTRILQEIQADPETVDLTEAETIFCAGKGCSRENFEQLQELCHLLKVSLGVTRPLYDQGWCGFERMIGQTGRTVKPRLYVSFGVSGSMHHVGGIKDSGKIIAVNNDARAPIFAKADEGFVADVQELLPLMLEQAREMAGGEG